MSREEYSKKPAIGLELRKTKGWVVSKEVTKGMHERIFKPSSVDDKSFLPNSPAEPTWDR